MIFWTFSKFFKILSNFSRKFGEKLRIFRTCASVEGHGAESPEAREFHKNFDQKLMLTCNFEKIFMNYERIILCKKVFIIRVNLMEY